MMPVVLVCIIVSIFFIYFLVTTIKDIKDRNQKYTFGKIGSGKKEYADRHGIDNKDL